MTARYVPLPEELVFLFGDQGTYFMSVAFAKIAQKAGFMHFACYRHWSQSIP
jgi:hypothetical protein